MQRPRGIRYYGGGGYSGYGLAALANVRLLVNAGIPVHWIPLDWSPRGMVPAAWTLPDGTPQPLLDPTHEGPATSDVATLVRRTSAPIACDTVIAHSPPETWGEMFAPGCRNIGCVAWETDRVPPHWLPALARATRLVVPSRNNAEAFARSGVQRPIHVVPHVRRHVWAEFTPAERATARADLGVAADHTLYYSINSWDPRKALPDLIEAWGRAFPADAPVVLVIKTAQIGYGPGPLYTQRATRELAAQAITATTQRLGRAVAPVRLHDEPLDSAGIDLLHSIGDVYVSTSRGEGYGLGAFEAATSGTPVIATGWGGHTDFLGERWPGAIPYRLRPAPVWPPYQPSYFPTQRWAEPDLDAAAALLRAHHADPQLARRAAQAIREHIVQRCGEPRVANDWFGVLHG